MTDPTHLHNATEADDDSTMKPVDDLERFRALVFADAELEAALRAPETWPEFVQTAVAGAAERGLTVTPRELDAFRDAARRARLERWI